MIISFQKCERPVFIKICCFYGSQNYHHMPTMKHVSQFFFSVEIITDTIQAKILFSVRAENFHACPPLFKVQYTNSIYGSLPKSCEKNLKITLKICSGVTIFWKFKRNFFCTIFDCVFTFSIIQFLKQLPSSFNLKYKGYRVYLKFQGQTWKYI